MQRRRRWLKVVWFVVGLSAAYLAMCFWLASLYLSPIRTSPSAPPGVQEESIGKHPVWITSGFRDQPSDTVFVLAHGYGGDRGHWSGLILDLKRMGYDSLAPAFPAHDANPEGTVGFGPKESLILAQAAEWARERGAKRVIGVGVSMGGAATWLASDSFDGVVTEGAYARFDDAMDHWLSVALPGGSVLLRPVVWIAKNRSGIDPASIVPLERAAQWKGKPALVIHADDDRLMLRSHAERLSEASGAELWCVPGAAHASCYGADAKGYADRLDRFAQAIAVSK